MHPVAPVSGLQFEHEDKHQPTRLNILSFSRVGLRKRRSVGYAVFEHSFVTLCGHLDLDPADSEKDANPHTSPKEEWETCPIASQLQPDFKESFQ